MTALYVIAIVSIFLSVVCLLYAIHVSIIYNTFNKNVKQWSEALDDATQESINRSARNILRELDQKISEQTNNLINEKKNE